MTNFITKIIETYNKGLKYDKLYTKWHDLDIEFSHLLEYKDELIDELDALEKDNIAKIHEIAELKKDLESLNKHYDINSLRDWYEGRRVQKTWKYNGRRLGIKDVKEYLTPSCFDTFYELADTIIAKKKFSNSSKVYKIIEAVMKHFFKWTYIRDSDKFGKLEWWEDPVETLHDMTGDCESKAMVMYNTIVCILDTLDLSEHAWRITFVCSMVLGEGGHGYLTYLHDDGCYYTVESTYDAQGSFMKTWLKTPINENNMYYSFWGFATHEKSWKGSNSAFMKFNE